MPCWDRWFAKDASPDRAQKVSQPQSSRPHSHLSAAQVERVRRIHQHLEALDGLTLEQRIVAFEGDAEVEDELLLAELTIMICGAADHNFPPLSCDQKREIYGLATLGTMASPDQVLLHYPPRTITRAQAQQVLAWMAEALHDVAQVRRAGPLEITFGAPRPS
jgi:hypothetical protein